MTIIVDAYGGDHAPLEILRGAVQAAAQYDCDILLTGDEAALRRLAEQEQLSLDRISFVDAPDVIRMEDHPKSILREHKDSSLGTALRLLSEGRGDALVSAGSTRCAADGRYLYRKAHQGHFPPGAGTHSALGQGALYAD